MKNCSYIIPFFLLLNITGCGNRQLEEDNVISINPKEALQSINLSEIADSIEYIKLETNAESMMVRVGQIIIMSQYIYASDYGQKTLFVFDKKGKYVTKLAKEGEGPEEYRRLGPFFISEDEEYVEIIDFVSGKTRILKYQNITFEFLEEKKFSAPNANSCRRENNIYYCSTQQNDNFVSGENTNADIIVVKDGEIQKSLFHKQIITNGNYFSPNSESFTQNRQGDIFVSLMYNNTFFQLSEMEAHPILTVDFGKYNMDKAIGLRSTKEQMEFLDKNTDEVASFPILNINEPNLLAFTYNFKENSKNSLYQYLHFKNSGRIFHTQEIINDFSDFPEKIYLNSSYFSINHEVMHEDYLVDILLPWYSLSQKKVKEIDMDEIGTVKAEDNPVIILMKLKEEFHMK